MGCMPLRKGGNKMRNDLTDIVFVVDRSGSMGPRRLDAEGGINAFIEDQKIVGGDALFTLIQFDDRYEFVHKGIKMEDVPPYTLRPRGWTALFDAVGRAINETGERLNAMPESERPGNVIVVIVTDGQENSSKEFIGRQIHGMITHQQEKYNWNFTYIGSEASTFADSAALGISKVSTLQYDPKNTCGTYETMSCAVSRSRQKSGAGASASVVYTDAERNAVS